MNLARPILDAIEAQGYDTPTPIQAKSIAPILEGRDLLGCAQTGTGKTAAFALPILNRLHSSRVDKRRRGRVWPRALVLSPTRELAGQIDESFGTYGRHTGLGHTVIYGGVSQFHQVRRLERGVDILVATPGRLMDLMEQHLVDLSFVEVFVLDEADRMLDMGFIQPIRYIASALPRQRQTLLFSATMPRTIMHLADSLLRDPVKVTVAPVASTAALIDQSVYMVPRQTKLALIEHLLAGRGVDRALIFTRTKHGADKLTKKLNQGGVTTEAIHGNKAQNHRLRALEAFRSGRSRVLVATDVAARGLDVDGITHVFNYDLPNEPECYVHRIGRTGRAGANGVAISFCDRDERGYLHSIERLTGKPIAPIALPSDLPSTPRPAQPPYGTANGSGGHNSQDQGRSRNSRAGAPGSRRRRAGGPGQGIASKPARNGPAGPKSKGPKSRAHANGSSRHGQSNSATRSPGGGSGGRRAKGNGRTRRDSV